MYSSQNGVHISMMTSIRLRLGLDSNFHYNFFKYSYIVMLIIGLNKWIGSLFCKLSWKKGIVWNIIRGKKLKKCMGIINAFKSNKLTLICLQNLRLLNLVKRLLIYNTFNKHINLKFNKWINLCYKFHQDSYSNTKNKVETLILHKKFIWFLNS